MVLGIVFVSALNLLGFSSTGVVAGSAAAWFQSTFLGGIIASGSLFSLFQSAAMLAVWKVLINFFK